jgi:hypothetical protein
MLIVATEDISEGVQVLVDYGEEFFNDNGPPGRTVRPEFRRRAFAPPGPATTPWSAPPPAVTPPPPPPLAPSGPRGLDSEVLLRLF